MSELLTTFGPILAFMLIPIWIPLSGALGGAVLDLVRGNRRLGSGVEYRVAEPARRDQRQLELEPLVV